MNLDSSKNYFHEDQSFWNVLLKILFDILFKYFPHLIPLSICMLPKNIFIRMQGLIESVS